jgi:hypothetical protein
VGGVPEPQAVRERTLPVEEPARVKTLGSADVMEFMANVDDRPPSRRRRHIGSASRFIAVGLVPAAAIVALVLALLMSGAPATAPDLDRLSRRINGLGFGGAALVLLFMILLALLSYSLQSSMLRLLEGYWEGSSLGRVLSSLGVRLHRRRLDRLVEVAYGRTATAQDKVVQRLARRRLESGYPSDEERLLPTRLGNALRAFEDQAGQRYGLETVVVFPRLTPYLSDPVRAALDDLRDQLDIAARLCITLLLATVISAALLLTHGWWLALPAAIALLAWVAYRSAIQAAIAYGEEVAVAFDLHRFEMLRGLHFPLPDTTAAELILNDQVSRFLTERRSLEDLNPGDYPDYDHPAEPRATSTISDGRDLVLR